jgi:hypothetical protein
MDFRPVLFVACCVGNALCDGLITRVEKFYWVCLFVGNPETKNKAG